MSKSLLCAIVVFVSGAPSTIEAQEKRAALAPGDVVRMESTRDAERFTVEGLSRDSLVLRHTAPGGRVVQLALNSVSTLEVRRRRSRGAGALQGAGLVGAIGALGGALMGYASGDDPDGWFALTAGEKAVISGGILGILGVGLGTALGASSPPERWEKVATHGALGVAHKRGSGLAVTYSINFR